jgi:hypothetical protein
MSSVEKATYVANCTVSTDLHTTAVRPPILPLGASRGSLLDGLLERGEHIQVRPDSYIMTLGSTPLKVSVQHPLEDLL